MASFIIEGGYPLSGTITPQGAKNEALEVICATLLTEEEVSIANIPNIRDVNNLIVLLEKMGVEVKRQADNTCVFCARSLNLDYLQSDDFVYQCSSLRGSVMMIGPLLARFGKAVIAKPGGDKIGRRRLDTHFLGFEKLGATFHHLHQRDVYEIKGEQLKGCYMLLDEASVTGTANIIMAAVDTTQRPIVYINGEKLANDRGLYEVATARTGVFDYSGYIEVPHGDGSITKHEFSSSYTVVEPMATVSATMMNVLYAGINNPISIAVPGIPNNAISASMTNGTLTRNGDQWIAHPTKVGAEAVVTVTATIDGHSQTVATTNFRVRKLPDPMPFITYNDSKGNKDRYRGGRPFAKTLLLAAPGIEAAIDDDLLNVTYKVLSFETVFFDSMGNAIPEVSNGAAFSERQKNSFRRLSRGKRFYISRVKAVGPDGIERVLAPMEVIVN